MKKFFALLLAIVAIAGWAENNPDQIPLETYPKDGPVDEKILRSPVRNLVEAFYNSECKPSL